MGSAAPAVEEFSLEADPQPVERTELKPDVKTEARPEANADSLRDAVLNALANQQMLVSILESAEWSLIGNALTAKVAASSTMIEMSFTADARRIAGAAASGQAGRPIKMQVEPGGSRSSRRPAPRPAIQRKRPQPSRTGSHRAAHERKIQSGNPHRDRLSGERIEAIGNRDL